MDNKTRILDGAAELFKTYGIKAVTMDSLASYLGISKRTIYEVFSDKDELLRGVLTHMTEKQKSLLRKLSEESENAIEAIFKILEFNTAHFQGMSPAFQSDLKRYHQEVLMKGPGQCEMPDFRNHVSLIIRGMDEKLFKAELNPDIVNRCLYSLGLSIWDFELYPFEEFTRRDVVKNVLINYLKGISTQQGLNLIDQLESKY